MTEPKIWQEALSRQIPAGEDTHEGWRNKRLGASEVATLVLPPGEAFGSPIELWRRKRGEIGEQPANERMAAGLAIEPVIADLYATRSGRTLLRCRPIVHREYPWSAASPDRLVLEEPIAVELKNTTSRRRGWGEPGTDQIPASYAVQVAVQMAVLDVGEARLVALLDGHELREYVIHRDTEIEAAIYAKCAEWWQRHVVDGNPPPVDGTDGYAEYLAKRFGRNVQPMLRADDVIGEMAARLREARRMYDAAERAKTEAENLIKSVIGDADGIEGDGFKITWRAAKDSQRVEWEKVARDAGASADLIAKHTTTKPGSRRLLAKWDGEEG